MLANIKPGFGCIWVSKLPILNEFDGFLDEGDSIQTVRKELRVYKQSNLGTSMVGRGSGPLHQLVWKDISFGLSFLHSITSVSLDKGISTSFWLYLRPGQDMIAACFRNLLRAHPRYLIARFLALATDSYLHRRVQ